MQLEGKRIIVTGGARGIGASAVRALAAEGAAVASLDVADELGEMEVAEADGAGPGRARYFHCDVMSRADVNAAFTAAVRDLGGLDSLVHVAGIEGKAPAEEITDELWQRVLSVNATGTMLTNQAAFWHLKDRGGSILNFASDNGLRGMPNAGAYSASKGAVLAWTRTLAQEWAQYGITVNAVCPGMWTPMYEETRARMDPQQLTRHDEMMAVRIPLGGKLGNPDRDMAPFLVFMTSDGARFITGQTLCVDGGLTMTR